MDEDDNIMCGCGRFMWVHCYVPDVSVLLFKSSFFVLFILLTTVDVKTPTNF